MSRVMMASRYAVMWVIFCVFLLSFGLVANGQPPSHSNWQVTFSDDFNGPLNRNIWKDREPGTLSPDYWRGAKDGNGTPIVRPYVNPNNAFTQNGNLVLRITQVSPNVYNVGYLRTRERTNYTFSQKFGYFEARMKLGMAPGTWGAFWLMPNPGRAVLNVDNSGRDGAEIDIVEGFNPGYVNHAVHFDDYTVAANGTHQHAGFRSYLDADQWHVYGLEWTPDELIWYIDGEVVQRLNRNTYLPITNEYLLEPSGNTRQIRQTNKTGDELIPQVPGYMKLSAHVISGTWHGDIDPAELPLDTLVDYVRVYRNTGARVSVSTPTAPSSSSSFEGEGASLDSRLKVVYDNAASGGQAVTPKNGQSLGNVTQRVSNTNGSAPVTLTIKDVPGPQLVKLFRNGSLVESWSLNRDTNDYESFTTTNDVFFETSGTTLQVRVFEGAVLDKIEIGTPETQPAPVSPQQPASTSPTSTVSETINAKDATLDSRLKTIFDSTASSGQAVTTKNGSTLGNITTNITGINGSAPVSLTVYDGPGTEIVKLFRNGVLVDEWALTQNTNAYRTVTTDSSISFQTSGTTLQVRLFSGARLDKIDIGSPQPKSTGPATTQTSGTVIEAEAMTLDSRLAVRQVASASNGRNVEVRPAYSLGTARMIYNGPSGQRNVTLTLTDEPGADIVKLYHNGAIIASWDLLLNNGATIARTNALNLKTGDEISVKLFGDVTFDKITISPAN